MILELLVYQRGATFLKVSEVKPRLRVGCAVGITAAPVQFALAAELRVEDVAGKAERFRTCPFL